MIIQTSPLRIRYIFLMRDKAGIDGLFYASDRRLLDMSHLMNILWGLPRGTTEYLPSVPRKAFYNFILGFNSFAVHFVYEAHLNEEITKFLDKYPLKVLITKEEISDNTLEKIKNWVNRPIILVESAKLAIRMKSLFDSPVLLIDDITLPQFEQVLCDVTEKLMKDALYVKSLPWDKKQINILEKMPNLIRDKRESCFPAWPLRKNKIIESVDLLINRNRGHIDFQEIDFKSSEEVWARETVAAVYQCFAEMSLMEALAYFENNELTDNDFEALGVDKESLVDILRGDQEQFTQVVNTFMRRYDLLQRNHGIILWSPSINPYFQKKVYALINEVYKESFNKRIPERIMKAFLKDTGYILKFSPGKLFKGDKEMFQVFVLMMEEFARENDLFSNITSFFCLRNNRPRIKTPKLSSSFFGRMRELQNLILHDVTTPKTIKKFNKLWKELRRDLTNSVPEAIRNLLYRLPNIPIQIFSDLPIECMEINGTPILFGRELSRLPLSSANGLLMHYQVTEEPLYISKDINKPHVLLIDGVAEKDPVKSLTKNTINLLKSPEFLSVFSISGHEVNDVAELFCVIQEKKPFICLIDAHAKYDKEDDIGLFLIGNQNWNPWTDPLPYAPPIIILNSCQTSIVDGTFNTAANGLLANGTRSVIATLFPISAEIGSFICVRLFANLAAALTGEESLLTWRTVVSKTIMLNSYLDYFVQFIKYLAKKSPRDISKMDKFPLDYTARWNAKRNKDQAFHQKKFEDYVFETVSEVINDYGLIDQFRNFIDSHGVIPETSFFISLGTPESIITFDPERARDHFSTFSLTTVNSGSTES